MTNTINLAQRFANSDRFRDLFRQGMRLVEETATYLDGEGRAAAKALPHRSVILYGSESMRLTTRLMQLASWLLLQRAYCEGEMTRQQILEEKRKIKLDSLPEHARMEEWDSLPAGFLDLIERSLALQNRIILLDHEIYGRTGSSSPKAPSSNPVAQQIGRISAALGASTMTTTTDHL